MTPDLPPAPPEVELHGWVEAGVAMGLRNDEDHEDAGPHVGFDLARLQVKAHHRGYGGMLQVEAATGTVQLLDAVVELGDPKRFSVRAGRFKMGVSQDFAVPAPQMILPTRARFVSLTPRREVGVEAQARIAEVVRVRVGAFDPVTDLTVTGPGISPSLAVDVDLPADLSAHAGAATWVHPPNALEKLGDHAPITDRVADVGVEWRHDGNTVAVEGMVAHEIARDVWDSGASVLAAHRIHAGSAEVEPAAGWDVLVRPDDASHRATGAMNLHLDDWSAVASLSLEATFASAKTPPMEVARAQLQLGF
ncbi:MAG: hypothetical protein H6737_04770 [Alphaproteobacteria bacterium]|nr:hypothetical protein [Alphaproteobacteria bacterium]